MAEEYEKYALLKNAFRRRSSTEFTGAGFNQVVDANQVGSILGEMGSTRVNPEDVKKQTDLLDPAHTGKLTYDQYQKLCDKFASDPTRTSEVHKLKGFSDFAD